MVKRPHTPTTGKRLRYCIITWKIARANRVLVTVIDVCPNDNSSSQ
jgi:hypothetical protein